MLPKRDNSCQLRPRHPLASKDKATKYQHGDKSISTGRYAGGRETSTARRGNIVCSQPPHRLLATKETLQTPTKKAMYKKSSRRAQLVIYPSFYFPLHPFCRHPLLCLSLPGLRGWLVASLATRNTTQHTEFSPSIPREGRGKYIDMPPQHTALARDSKSIRTHTFFAGAARKKKSCTQVYV